MKTFLKALNIRINSLSLRERKLIALTSTSTVIAVFTMLVWLPLWNALQMTTQDNIQLEIDINTSKNSIFDLEERSKRDVNLPYRNKLEALKENLSFQKEEIDNITSALIQPDRMNMVFKGLLEKSNLKFESIKNFPPNVIELGKSNNSNQVLYEHSLLLEMKGKYIDSLEYIQSIENQEWQLYWDEVEFKILKYPLGILTLRVHTLSTSDKVLGL